MDQGGTGSLLMLTSAAGDETGWSVDVRQLCRFLSVPADQVRDELMDWSSKKSPPVKTKMPQETRIHEFIFVTWNLHGKHLSSIQNLLDGTEDPPDALSFHEVGGFSDLPQGEGRKESVSFSGVTYRTFVYQTPFSHRCTALLLRQDLILEVKHRHVFGSGFILEGNRRAELFGLAVDTYLTNREQMLRRCGCPVS